MSAGRNTITWINRDTRQLTHTDVAGVVLFHAPGVREVHRITVCFDLAPFRYRMDLRRRERGFEGGCERMERDTAKPIDTQPLRCSLMDGLGSRALVLGGAVWVDDRQEFDWLGQFHNVRRMASTL